MRYEMRGLGKSSAPPAGSFLDRAQMASTLNQICGCTTFTAWNVLELPEIDLWEVNATLTWKAELRKKYGI